MVELLNLLNTELSKLSDSQKRTLMSIIAGSIETPSVALGAIRRALLEMEMDLILNGAQ